MALRDKLAERCAAHLEPGEQVRHVFMAQTGLNPYFSFVTYILFFWMKYKIVCVTDRSTVIFKATVWKPSFPKAPFIIARLDRVPMVGADGSGPSGLWGKVLIGGESHYVHKRFHKDVEAANAELGGGFAPPAAAQPVQAAPAAAASPQPTQPAQADVAAGWYPDPHGQAAQRYWDGATWTEHTA